MALITPLSLHLLPSPTFLQDEYCECLYPAGWPVEISEGNSSVGGLAAQARSIFVMTCLEK